jgi:hypothetical protein
VGRWRGGCERSSGIEDKGKFLDDGTQRFFRYSLFLIL